MFRNVLVHVDESAASQAALSQAVGIAQLSQGRIGLLAVIPPLSAWASAPPFALPVSRQQMQTQLEAAAQHSLDRAEGAVPADTPVTKLAMRAKPANALLAQVRDGPWDVVIVGDRLAGCPFPMPYGLTRLLRGSPVPVLVVGQGCERPSVVDVEEARRGRTVGPVAIASE